MSSLARPILNQMSTGLTWERVGMMLVVLVPLVAWHQDELYVWGWTAVAAMLVVRTRSGQVSLRWGGLAAGLVALAAMGHPWNRHALLYLGAALAMTLTPKRNEISRQAASSDVWIATVLYGVGIWGGWLFEGSSPRPRLARRLVGLGTSLVPYAQPRTRGRLPGMLAAFDGFFTHVASRGSACESSGANHIVDVDVVGGLWGHSWSRSMAFGHRRGGLV